MTTNSQKLETLMNELKNHPKLLERFSHIVAMVKSQTCRVNDPNDFEEQVIDKALRRRAINFPRKFTCTTMLLIYQQ